MKQTRGILRDWNYGWGDMINGKIYHDISGRFRDGDSIETSSIRYFSENGKYAHTQNSIYELDPPINVAASVPDFQSCRTGNFFPHNSLDGIVVLNWQTDKEKENNK